MVGEEGGEEDKAVGRCPTTARRTTVSRMGAAGREDALEEEEGFGMGGDEAGKEEAVGGARGTMRGETGTTGGGMMVVEEEEEEAAATGDGKDEAEGLIGIGIGTTTAGEERGTGVEVGVGVGAVGVRSPLLLVARALPR